MVQPQDLKGVKRALLLDAGLHPKHHHHPQAPQQDDDHVLCKIIWLVSASVCLCVQYALVKVPFCVNVCACV